MKLSSLPGGVPRGKSGHALDIFAPAVFALLISCPPVFADGVFKWIDEQGRVHYGDRPPAATESRPVDTAPAPAAAPRDAARREKIRRLLDAFESERSRERAAARRVQAEQAQRQRNCELARRRVALLGRANSVSRRGDNGDRVYLSEAERVEAMAASRALVRKWCK